MRINYNVSSIIARNALNNNDKRVAASTQRLSSGYKINSAADDAAGLAIARRMNSQIKSLQEANRSANDGLSALNTADGAMSEMHDILQRMNELAIQSANGTNADSDRTMIQNEIDQLVNELDRIANTTQFNAQNLLDGSFAYKAYTSIDNTKVMSYTEGVSTGTYIIGQLKYYHYDELTTRYKTEETKIKDTDGKLVNVTYASTQLKVTESEHFDIDNNNNILNDSLVTSSSLGQYSTNITQAKPFPEGSKVSVKDDKIVITAQGNFEMKIAVNDRTPLGDVTITTVSSAAGVSSIKKEYDNKTVAGGTVVTTTSYSTVKTYHNIAVKGPNGKRYNIGELNFFNNTDSKSNAISNQEIYTDFRGDNGRGLKEDFADFFKERNPQCVIDIDSVAWDDKSNTFEIAYTATDSRTGVETAYTEQFTLYEDTNDYGDVMETQKKLENYLYSEKQITRTEYVIGNNDPEDCLKIDVTGMGPMEVQVGANEGQYMTLDIPALNAVNLGVDKIDLTTMESARLSIDVIGDAINELSAVRAKIGAYSNRLEHTITNLDTTEENITASYSRIMDVDMATEMTEYSTVQVLVQASTSMLAQANERPQQVLQLIQ